MKTIILAAAMAVLIDGAAQAGTTVSFPVNDNPLVVSGGNNIEITEYGTPGQKVVIQPTGFKVDRNLKRIGPDGPVGRVLNGTIGGDGKTTFNVAEYSFLGNQGSQVYDYTQQLGDPAVLSAAVFEGGEPVPMLGWLVSHGYTGSHPIIQPDFFSTDGSTMFVAVDFAKLGDTGAAFAAAHSFGDTFTLDASDMLPGLPGELFSTTLPVMGTDGWDVTPPPTGTQVVFGGFHSTIGDVPEPSTWAMLMVGMGLTGAAARRRRARSIQAG